MNAIQCKLARTALGLGVRDLAKNSQVSPDTISRLERGEELKQSTVDGIRKTLEVQGIQFLSNGDTALGDGVVLKEDKIPTTRN